MAFLVFPLGSSRHAVLRIRRTAVAELPSNNPIHSIHTMATKPPPAEEEAITCDALCSLSTSGGPLKDAVVSTAASSCQQQLQTTCAKHFQLPMFLSKTYHMIERCESEIACWSEDGDSFVVKNVDKFASVSGNE